MDLIDYWNVFGDWTAVLSSDYLGAVTIRRQLKTIRWGAKYAPHPRQ